MKNFLKIIFGTFFGIILFGIVSCLLFCIILYAALPSEPLITNNSVLKLDLNKKITERESFNLFSQLRLDGIVKPGNAGLLELRESIKEAASNDKIKGIFLNISSIDAGTATLEELRDELQEYKKSGKFLVAYSNTFSEKAFYLASVADKIYLAPSGSLEFNGLHIEILFYKNLLKKLGIEPEVFKVGEYKSAVEPFTADKMSAENREQLKVLLNSIYGNMLSSISASRDIPVKELVAMSDSMFVRNAEDALHYKLVTDLGYPNDVEDFMRKALHLDKDKDINYVNYRSLVNLQEKNAKEKEEKVAVLYAVGNIVDGKGSDEVIAADDFVKELRKAREDSSIKAIVLRINSPGGSALASDVIWSEIEHTRRYKPVIASMSDMAASGGYYIASGCDTIVAHPTTITGSIGVFGVMFNGKKFLNDKLYITTDEEQTGPFADMGSFAKPLSPEKGKIIQDEVDDIYKRFVSVVAQGRSLSPERVNEIAQGRVWTGEDAAPIKLVDLSGGLDEAVKIAAKKAHMKDYEVVYLPENNDIFLQALIAEMTEPSEKILEKEAGIFYPYIKHAREIKEMEGVQALFPYDMTIK